MPNAQSINHDNGTRLQALALAEAGIASKIVTAITEISRFTISRLQKQARIRGYDPEVSKKLLLSYVEDAPRSGRPPVITPQVEEAVIQAIRKDRDGREKTSFMLAAEQGISSSSVLRLLKRNNFRPCKTTKKPSLTEAMMEARYQFALRYQHWTIEDWKNVIWSDETSVVLNSRRGRIRSWRQPHEVYVRSTIRRRFVSAMEFMFWGCFSYDKKGPCHIWKNETAAEKRACEADLARMNADLEPEAKAQWELETAMRRIKLRNLGGPKPKWKFTAATGKVTISGKKGGITWYRYQKQVLIPKLLKFAQECKRDRPNTIVMEDKAPAHASKFQEPIFMSLKIVRLLWCGNSPDLNAIEPCWPWMKRRITEKGAPRTRKEAEKAWIKYWKDLSQQRIQAWIERIPRHIQEVIRLRGGNEYREGREGGDIRPYDPTERANAYIRSYMKRQYQGSK